MMRAIQKLEGKRGATTVVPQATVVDALSSQVGVSGRCAAADGTPTGERERERGCERGMGADGDFPSSFLFSMFEMKLSCHGGVRSCFGWRLPILGGSHFRKKGAERRIGMLKLKVGQRCREGYIAVPDVSGNPTLAQQRCLKSNIAVEDLTPNHGFSFPCQTALLVTPTSLLGWFSQPHAIHPVNFEVKPVEVVGDGGKVGPGLGFGWASGSGSAAWRGSGRRGVVRPLGEGLGANRPKLRGLCERANSGGYLEPFKDVHHHEQVREEVIVVSGRGDRHVDHDKLRPIDWRRVHDRVEKLEVLTGHDRVPVLPGLDDSGHDVEEETALGVRGVDGGAARCMADELGDAKLVEDKALVVEYPVLSTIVGDVVALVGEAGNAPKLLNGKLNRRALDKGVEHVVLTPEVGVERPDQRWVDLLPSPGDKRPEAGLIKLRVEVVVALQLRDVKRYTTLLKKILESMKEEKTPWDSTVGILYSVVGSGWLTVFPSTALLGLLDSAVGMVPPDFMNGVPAKKKRLSSEDKRKLSMNAKAINILHCSLGPDEFARVCSCKTAKEVWDLLQATHEGDVSTKQTMIALGNSEYESFKKGPCETIQDMNKRFNEIVNKLKSSESSDDSSDSSSTEESNDEEDEEKAMRMKYTDFLKWKKYVKRKEVYSKPKKERHKPRRGIKYQTVPKPSRYGVPSSRYLGTGPMVLGYRRNHLGSSGGAVTVADYRLGGNSRSPPGQPAAGLLLAVGWTLANRWVSLGTPEIERDPPENRVGYALCRIPESPWSRAVVAGVAGVVHRNREQWPEQRSIVCSRLPELIAITMVASVGMVSVPRCCLVASVFACGESKEREALLNRRKKKKRWAAIELRDA
ncbi:unnamed protein product [Cuscuta campestris]|uniref:Uncharacterized protein n=1 Tax=Cuscuta campestris TaxID=132261 RepID=A0A484LUI8_9ASTE|nr:unnamed protein product [Cuscuta campestris]